MSRVQDRFLSLAVLIALALVMSSCGTRTLKLAASEPENIRHGGELFTQRCAGCHTLSIAGTEGSAISPKSKMAKNGPNFDVRREQTPQILYAIRNGGFGSGPMPQNIVVGKDAQDVAAFLAKYSGRYVPKIPAPR